MPCWVFHVWRSCFLSERFLKMKNFRITKTEPLILKGFPWQLIKRKWSSRCQGKGPILAIPDAIYPRLKSGIIRPDYGDKSPPVIFPTPDFSSPVKFPTHEFSQCCDFPPILSNLLYTVIKLEKKIFVTLEYVI